MINHSQYSFIFGSVCSGLGCKVNEDIVNKCYSQTNNQMTAEMLKRVGVILDETSKRHPVFSDFISAAYQAGWRREVQHKEKGTCGIDLCDGSGYLSVQKNIGGNWFCYIVRCACHVGKSISPTSGNDQRYFLKSWDFLRANNLYRLYEQA